MKRGKKRVKKNVIAHIYPIARVTKLLSISFQYFYIISDPKIAECSNPNPLTAQINLRPSYNLSPERIHHAF